MEHLADGIVEDFAFSNMLKFLKFRLVPFLLLGLLGMPLTNLARRSTTYIV